MDIETKMDVFRRIGEEIVTEQELRSVLETNDMPVAYDGFEPSGVAHLPFGVIRSHNIKLLTNVGVKFKVYLADYFGYINNKMGGDLDAIRDVGHYFVEVWKAAGLDTKKVEFVWAKDLMDDLSYWDLVLKIAKSTSIKRSLKATTVMGRTEGTTQSTAQLMYPVMQATDIFKMNIDICQLGMDQRKANMLARDVASKINLKKPVAVHHHILSGLQGPQAGEDSDARMIASKMSKSNPNSCIYVHDTEDQIKKKLNKAFCPEKQVVDNPVLEYAKYVIFEQFGELNIERPDKFGGDVSFGSYSDLVKSFETGNVHPADLKGAVGLALAKTVAPIREHFENNKKARELYEKVSAHKITR